MMNLSTKKGAAVWIAGLLALVVLATGCRTEAEGPPAYRFVKAWGQRGEAPGAFREPLGIFISGDEVFVSDAGNDRIQVFDRDGRFLRQFGVSGDGPGELGRPMHLGMKGDTLLVPEYLNDRIQLFSREGKPLGAFGTPGDGPGAFDAPTSAAVDAKGLVYVADFYNQRIQVIDLGRGMVRQYGTTGQDGPAPGQFTYPTAVAHFADGGFVVADAYNHRVQTFGPDGAFRWMVPDDVNWADTTRGHFNVATSVTVGPREDVYVADFYNHRLQVLSKDGAWLAIVGGPGAEEGRFERPTDMAFDADGNLYVVDFGNDRIQKFAPER